MSWTVQHQETDDIYWIEDENHQTIADLYFKKGNKAYFKFLGAEENAPILAAAPELLEALEEMYEKCNVSPDDAPHRVKARAAIAKARGES